jgi:hypothetical protein
MRKEKRLNLATCLSGGGCCNAGLIDGATVLSTTFYRNTKQQTNNCQEVITHANYLEKVVSKRNEKLIKYRKDLVW